MNPMNLWGKGGKGKGQGQGKGKGPTPAWVRPPKEVLAAREVDRAWRRSLAAKRDDELIHQVPPAARPRLCRSLQAPSIPRH